MKYQQFAPKRLDLELIEINHTKECIQNKNLLIFIEALPSNINYCCICTKYGTLLQLQSAIMYRKYFEQFNFYFAKPINEILVNVLSDQVILFKDLLFFNDDNEYLKRYYRKDEIHPRMQILSDFYNNQYKVEDQNNLIIQPPKESKTQHLHSSPQQDNIEANTMVPNKTPNSLDLVNKFYQIGYFVAAIP